MNKNINKEEILVGSDIEVFLKDQSTGNFKSSVGLIEGSKEKPYELAVAGCCTQLDNVSTEFNVPPVMLSEPDLMWENISFVKNYLAAKFEPQGYQIECCASASFNFEELLTPEANTFGCDPDFNAWYNGRPNVRPELEDPYFRCAGGHVHIGYPNPSKKLNLRIIQAMDITLGLPSLFLDIDERRRTLYGKAGAFRHKAFGVEYRVLSNFWAEDKKFVDFVFNGVNQALDLVNSDVDFTEDKDMIIKAIDSYDRDLAINIMSKYNVPLEVIEESTSVII